MSEKCYKCGTNSNVFQLEDPEDFQKDVQICKSCIYYECKSCHRKMTIEDLGFSKCCCGKKDICYKCEELGLHPSGVKCPYCDNPFSRKICNDQKCKELALQEYRDSLEFCSFCLTEKRCMHIMICKGTDEDPYMNKKSSFCCYKDCRKWICPSCTNPKKSFMSYSGEAGFYCKEHYDQIHNSLDEKQKRNNHIMKYGFDFVN